MSVNIPKCLDNLSKSLYERLPTRITRLPIVTMNDYRHFATGPYSRGEIAAWTGGGLLRWHGKSGSPTRFLEDARRV